MAKHEGMTCDYDLPAEGAYLETCAAIALVFWAHRLFLATGEGEYLDVMERALYNGTISATDRQGAGYFYGNPLAAHPGFDGNGLANVFLKENTTFTIVKATPALTWEGRRVHPG